ncbi:MAG: hypothetical protein FJZ88_08125, partial [Chloroflexi bacterium]|nr:hypothetical protein [Chloroflexota bacterium]
MAWPTFRFKPVTVFTTTLDGTITAVTDPINVVGNTLAADGPGLLKVENEIIKYTTKGSNQFSGLTRGHDGTSAVGHATGVTVTHPIAGDIFTNLWDGIEYLKGIGSGQTTVEFGLPITSDTDNTDDLGSSTKAWKDLYLKGSIKRAAVTVFSIDANSIITFGLFPITPSSAPTTDYQVANKKYADDEIDKEGLYLTTIASSATPTPARASKRNAFTVTALAEGATFAAPSGTPADSDSL